MAIILNFRFYFAKTSTMLNRFLIFIILSFFALSNLFNQTSKPALSMSSDSAIVYFNNILKRNKNSSFALYGLASVYFTKSDFNNSLLYSKQNLKSKNDFDTACSVIYACSLDRTGRIKEAIGEFESSIKTYPNNYLLRQEYALSCYKYRDHKKAQLALDSAIRINPYSPVSHYLLGCSMFENNNDANSIYPFLLGLMIDNDTVRALNSILFIKCNMEKKPGQINIPFFESRQNIGSLNEILNYYFPAKSKWQLAQDMQAINLIKTIEIHLSTIKSDSKSYEVLFIRKIIDAGLLEPYLYYCVRTMNDEYVKLWIKNHSQQLTDLAVYLDKNLNK